MNPDAPMKLYEPKRFDVAGYIADEAWYLEQKMDGIRVLANVGPNDDGLRLTGWISSNGTRLKSTTAAPHLNRLARDLQHALSQAGIDGAAQLDGELVGGVLYLFDAPRVSGRHGETAPYSQRRSVVEEIVRAAVMWNIDSIRQVPVARTAMEKHGLWQLLLASHVEGGVAKRHDGQYAWGTRSREAIKLKRTHIAHLVVSKVTGRTHRTGSAELSTVDGRVVGSASLIGKDPAIDNGVQVEVRYLHWTGLALMQPRIIGRSSAEPTTVFPAYSKEPVLITSWT